MRPPALPLRAWLRALCHEARHVPSASTEACLEVWLQRQRERRDNPSFAEDFARHQPIPGARAADYGHRLCVLPGFGRSLLGIRFRGGDRGWPFVDLLAWEARPAPDDAAWPQAIQAIAAEFAVFRPRAVRLLLADPPPARCAAEADLCWLVGVLADLPRPPLPPGCRSRPLRLPDDAARVTAAYAELPEALRPHLSPATAADLAPPTVALCLEDGATGDWIGLAAAQPAQEWALAGHVMLEEVIAPPLRGRGWGRPLQQALLQALPATAAGGLVFGTIHAQNLPSLRTALACGRREVARWWMLPTDR